MIQTPEIKDSRRLPQIQLQVLKTLLAIKEGGSAQAAAAKVKLTISALTRQITLLEHQLGTKLFERHARGMRLTAEGAAYAQTAARILAELERAASELDEIEAVTRGHVRVHISEVLVDDYLLPEIDALTAENPLITVEVLIASAEQARDAILNNNTDFATLFGLRNHHEIEVVTKIVYPLIAVVAPTHRLALAGIKELDPAALLSREISLAIPPHPYATRAIFESLLTKHPSKKALREYPSLSLNSLEHLKQAVLLGHAVAVLPALTVRREIEDKKLVSIRLTGADSADTSFTLCRHRTRPLSPAARLLFGKLNERLTAAFPDHITKMRQE